MFKEIFKALRGEDALAEMIAKVGQMLEAGQWMFDKAAEVLMKQTDWKAISDDLYARDKQINDIERKVREQIITHLSMGHQGNLPACLVLMSVVKDAERIGDYCKNIFEVGRFYRKEYSHPQFAMPLESIRGDVRPLFQQAEKAFVEADRDLANKTLTIATGLIKECDLLIRQLLSLNDKMPPDEAVAYVLLSRFYKRVTAHLANIATTVVSPVPTIDHRNK